MKYYKIKALARKLRNNPTPSEVRLWKEIRNKQIDGRKFLRQHPIIYEKFKEDFFFYIPDFYCAREKLVVELDGPVHELRKAKDLRKDLILEAYGLRIIRFKNEDLNDLARVISLIRNAFQEED